MFGLSPDDLSFFTKVFNIFSSHTEYMTSEELGLVMSSLGYCLTEVQLVDLVKEIDINGDGTVDFEEFLTLVFRMVQGTTMEQLSETYRQFDRDSNGHITENELQETMFRMGLPPSLDELQAIMQQADTNEDGQISQQDFYNLLIGSRCLQ